MLDEKLYDGEEISEDSENTQGFVAEDGDVGERLDRFVSDKAGVSRSLIVKLIEDGKKVKGVVVVIEDSKATSAKYAEINEELFEELFGF